MHFNILDFLQRICTLLSYNVLHFQLLSLCIAIPSVCYFNLLRVLLYKLRIDVNACYALLLPTHGHCRCGEFKFFTSESTKPSLRHVCMCINDDDNDNDSGLNCGLDTSWMCYQS